jgi:hypothetical protein
MNSTIIAGIILQGHYAESENLISERYTAEGLGTTRKCYEGKQNVSVKRPAQMRILFSNELPK